MIAGSSFRGALSRHHEAFALTGRSARDTVALAIDEARIRLCVVDSPMAQ